jgi:hypothetical protein
MTNFWQRTMILESEIVVPCLYIPLPDCMYIDSTNYLPGYFPLIRSKNNHYRQAGRHCSWEGITIPKNIHTHLPHTNSVSTAQPSRRAIHVFVSVDLVLFQSVEILIGLLPSGFFSSISELASVPSSPHATHLIVHR